MGYALVEFTITDTGSVEDAVAIEGYCSNSDPNDPATEFRPCTMFNSASARAALKLKYKPVMFSGQTIPFNRVLHRFTYVLDES
jgi:protein TonB